MFRKKRAQADFQAEIQAHIELEAARLRESGLSDGEALAAARRTFGNRTATEERFHESDRWLWWDHFSQDLRLAIRLLAKTPGWTAVAALTVALGIGTTAAVFSIVNSVLIRPLPFPNPHQLYWVTELLGRVKSENSTGGDYFSLREKARGLADLAAYGPGTPISWTGTDRPEQWVAANVTPSFFSVLQVPPLHGRVFQPDDDQPGPLRAVVLSYALWQRRFGGDAGIVGQTIRLDRQPVVVIGIMPRSFDFPKGTELWIPSGLNEAEERQRMRMRIVLMVARANPGVTAAQVNSELERLTPIVSAEYPRQYAGSGFIEGMRIYARPLQDSLVGSIRPSLLVFTGAAGLVLLIVCFNVANLMLARATTRRREIAVRVALGAPRRRIVWQLVTESLSISLLGGMLGLILAAAAIQALNSSQNLMLAGLPEISLGLATTAFTLGLSIVTGLLFGLAPAFNSLGFSVREALQRETRASSSAANLRRLRQGLVIAQLALSLTLLIGAGLLAKSFLKLRNTDVGFSPKSLLTAQISLAAASYPTPQRRIEFYQQALDGIQAIPRVESVAITLALPANLNNGSYGVFRVEHRAPVPRGQEPQTGMLTVSPGLFRTLGIPLQRGRLLNAQDRAGAPRNIVVNQAFAERFFPGEDPVGRRITVGVNNPDAWEEIVGVVGNFRQSGLENVPRPTIYRSFLQEADSFGLSRMAFVIRASADPELLTPAVVKTIASIDRDQPIFDVKTLDQRLSDALGSRRFNAVLIGCFASMAALLAAIGVYGVMSYLVTLRSQEMGIRLALGAQPPQILRLILREGVVLGMVGAVLGVAGALSLSRFLSTLLDGVSRLDPATYLTLTATLLAVVIVACYLPGRRAADSDPLTVLRHD